MARKPAMSRDTLAALGADRLAALVLDEAGRNAPFKRLAAAALAAAKGPEAVAAIVDRRLAALERARGFVDWEKRKVFAADLAATLSTIVGELGGADAETGLDRLLRFIIGAGAVLDRVDDSSGTVTRVYEDAAAAVPVLAERLDEADRVALAERLVGLLARDPHGLAGAALGGCLLILPPDRLAPVDAALALAQSALGPVDKGSDDWNRRLHRQRVLAMRKAVADRRGDVDAFLALERLRPAGTIDTLAVAERLLGAGRLMEALDWVRKPKPRGVAYMSRDDLADGSGMRDFAEAGRQSLEIRILEAAGEREAAQALRWAAFESHLAAATLRDIVAHCPDFGEFEALDRASALAAGHSRRYAALTFFLDWPKRDLAAKLVLTSPAAWDGGHYEILAPAAEALEDDHPAAATILYRALIDDILARGRSQAYGHAARHLAKLDALASVAAEKAGLDGHAAYRAGLKRNHGRKHGFWTLVDKS